MTPAQNSTRIPGSDRTWWLSLTAMLAALVTPVLLVQVPPLLDYPNHLARAYVLAAGGRNPVLNEMFEVDWKIVPNIGIDILIPALANIFDIHTSGRVVVAISLLLPVTGAIALSIVYFRKKSFWQLAAGMAAYNTLFLMGFLNFQLAAGIALWGAAAWISTRETRPLAAIACGAAVSVVAFLCHIFGFLFYALLIGSYELAALLKDPARSAAGYLSQALSRAVAITATLICPAILYVSSALDDTSAALVWLPAKEKLFNLLFPFLSYSIGFDIILIVPVLGFILACVLLRKVYLSLAAVFCLIALVVGYILLPIGLKGGYFVDSRMPVLIGFLVFAFAIPSGLGRRTKAVAGTILALAFIAKVSLVSAVWLQAQRDVSAVRQVISDIPPGKRVLVSHVWSDVRDLSTGMFAVSSRRIPRVVEIYMHFPAFALLDRHAFWSHIFAAESQQPISVRPAYRETWAGEFAPFPEDYRTLEAHAAQSRYAHLTHWDRKYDYLIVLNAEAANDLRSFLPKLLEFQRHVGLAALFAVRRTGS